MDTRNGRPSMVEGVTLGLVATGAVSIGVASVVGAVGAGIEIFGSPVPVSLPVDGAEMTSLSDADGIAAAEYTQSLVSFETLDAGTRWLLLAEIALPALATVIVCAALWWLGLSLIRQRAFRKSMVPVLATAAFALVVTGMIGPLFGAIARAQVVDQLTASGADTGGFWMFLFELNPASIGWGIALALVATAFEVGQRMQRDTAGLV
ncbi:hypothetical protein [Microbacterium murale]|uniref:DUF2975 domain-containing protein n=1 Tax=Microbacterium murale TaxID=1081040 RepID=A0ABQ1R9C9_9MICO|nr:hypothetical protein [Microbacterium murale]GGD62944.1 hypothetical protein GCM10007269_02690 [Microbacterium murale]